MVILNLIFSGQGWLYKWTNRIKGYQKRWFIISKNDFLVYFLTEDEANPRGWIQLQGSTMYMLGDDGLHFAVSSAEGVTIKMRASGVAECHQWMKALSHRHSESGKLSDITGAGISEEEVPENQPRSLPALIDEISTCTEHIGKTVTYHTVF